MEYNELKQRLTVLFAEEAQVRARALTRDLLSLDTHGRSGGLQTLLRDAHSLKGAAGLVESRAIESACHYMEELFSAALDGRLELDRAAIDLLLAATDAIADTGRRLSRGDPEPGALGELVPRLAALVSDMHRAPHNEMVAEVQPATQRRVLIVDDSATVRAMLKAILEAAGYEVAVALDGAEAWQILQHQGADVVVSDIEMPRMDGFDLIAAIRQSDRFKDLPIVLVTALETEQHKARAVQLGADAYLLKSSFNQSQLLDTIAKLI